MKIYFKIFECRLRMLALQLIGLAIKMLRKIAVALSKLSDKITDNYNSPLN